MTTDGSHFAHLHLVIKHLRLPGFRGGDEVFVEDIEDVRANLAQFALNLEAVVLDFLDLAFVALALFFLFNRGNDSPRSTTGTNDVLVRNGQQIPLLDGQLNTKLNDAS